MTSLSAGSAAADKAEFSPALAEESVWLAIRGCALGVDAGREAARAYHAEREAAYSELDPEARDRAFETIAKQWFRDLNLAAPVERMLAEQESCFQGISRVIVGAAVSSKQEGAEMLVSEEGVRTLALLIRPATLVDLTRALAFLRREFMHIADMLDPGFRYEPTFAVGGRDGAVAGEPDRSATVKRVVQDRYRILWDCSVDGRLVERGQLPGGVTRMQRLAEFANAFECLDQMTAECFSEIFAGPRPPHPRLVDLARDPETGFGLREAGSGTGICCALCGFPTAVFEAFPAELSAKILDAIRKDFPAWSPGLGLCPQCADIYSAQVEAPSARAS